MRGRWYGQSSFRLESGAQSVCIDPFAPPTEANRKGRQFDYPAIRDVTAQVLLITHEHWDHNGVEAVSGSPTMFRSRAGTFESPIGQVLAIASEHDDVAGTKRGSNIIFVFSLGGVRVAYFGDFGQRDLRPEQATVIGRPDLVFMPVGGVATSGADQAFDIVTRLGARWIVPMHYRTSAINFLEPVDAFVAKYKPGQIVRFDRPEFDTDDPRMSAAAPVVVLPAVPAGA